MRVILADTETNGLLDELTVIHCISALDPGSGERWFYGPDQIEEGLELLASADMLVFHNAIKFDIPAIQKVYPNWKPKGIVRDTLVLSRLIWTDLKDRDFRHLRKNKDYPKKLIGKHSLEAWGYRLLEYKGEFAGPWDTYTPEMGEYCVQDTEVLGKLWERIVEKQYSEEAIELEHAVAWIVARQERRGVAFNKEKAVALYATLSQRRMELEQELRKTIQPWYARDGKEFTPKRDNKKAGYTAGCPITKVKLKQFDPGNRHHLTDRLQKLFGWVPTEWTEGGEPKMDDEIISKLPYPEAKLIGEYLMVQKRIGQLAEGKEAWLKHEKNGRIHGGLQTNGAVTGRMTHQKPNLGQVPGVYDKQTGEKQPYGEESRELFEAGPGYVMVGCDADALELRDLAGYMAAYDEGAYIETVLRGDKSKGTDMHTINQKAIGLPSREMAKTWFYAYIYGAGDAKLGLIMAKGKKAGGQSRKSFESNLPALGKLVDAVKKKAKKQGYLRGLDGRRLHVRAEHSALNTLLQSAGALQMKKALVILDQDLQANGWTPGKEYEFVLNVHDEWQIEAYPEIAEEVGKFAAQAIRKAGEYFNFRCPLEGQYKIGPNWASTH